MRSPRQKLAALSTPALDAQLARFGTRTIKMLMQSIDPDLSEHDAQRYEDDLIVAAELWHRLTFLDAAARAACALIALESASMRALLEQELDVSRSPSTRAYVLTRFILNDPQLMIDDAALFDVSAELSLDDMTRALVGMCCMSMMWEVEHIDAAMARDLFRASELAPDTAASRIERLTKQYEQETYPGKQVSGISST